MIKIEVRADKAQKNLRAMALRLGDLRVPNRALAAKLYREVMLNFDQEGNDGTPWAPLAPSTIMARMRYGPSYSSKLRVSFRSEGASKAEAYAEKMIQARQRIQKKRGLPASIVSTSPRILQDTGALRQSFMPFSDEYSAGVGALSTREHADIAPTHEYGDPARNIPARPMLPTRDKGLQIALQVYRTFVDRAIEGGSIV